MTCDENAVSGASMGGKARTLPGRLPVRFGRAGNPGRGATGYRCAKGTTTQKRMLRKHKHPLTGKYETRKSTRAKEAPQGRQVVNLLGDKGPQSSPSGCGVNYTRVPRVFKAQNAVLDMRTN